MNARRVVCLSLTIFVVACSGTVDFSEEELDGATEVGVAPESPVPGDASRSDALQDPSTGDEASPPPGDAAPEKGAPDQSSEDSPEASEDQSAADSPVSELDQSAEPFDDAPDTPEGAAVWPYCGPAVWYSEPDIGAVPGPACSVDGYSTVPGVSIEFPGAKCVFTLAEAAAGISIPYAVVISQQPVPPLHPRPHQASCCTTSDGPFMAFEQLYGGLGMNYCHCESAGSCVPQGCKPPPPLGSVVGSYPGSFEWTGQNWWGPTDAGAPQGPPFPPGRYTLRVTTRGYRGTCGVNPYEVWGSLVIELVP